MTVEDVVVFMLIGKVGEEANLTIFCSEVFGGIIDIEVDVNGWVIEWYVIHRNISMFSGSQ